MPILRRNLQLMNPRVLALAGIGDQAGYTELTTSWDGLEAAPTFGFPYAPYESVADIGDGIGWKTSNSGSEPFSTDRLHAWGAVPIPEDYASILTLEAAMRGGANAGKVRFGLYLDNGNMTDSVVDVTAANVLPTTLLVMSSELSIGVSQAAGDVVATINSGPGSAVYVFLVMWRDATALGPENLVFPNAVICRRVRANSATSPYSSSGAAPSTYPASTTNGNRVAVAMWGTYRPVATTAPTLTSVAADDRRGIVIEWEPTDVRTDRARIERRKNGGSWVYAAVVEGVTSYTDPDLQRGATYEYRVVACYKNTDGPASSILSAVPRGPRYAAELVTPSLLANAPASELRGHYGQKHPIGFDQFELYKRTSKPKPYATGGPTEWGGVQRTSDPAVFDWSGMSAAIAEASSTSRVITRVRCVVPDNTAPDDNNVLPPFITANGSYYNLTSGVYYPNWMNSQVITWMDAWIDSFGANFTNDARIILLKVGVYNRWGEWSGFMPVTATTARQIDILDRVLAAFPNKYFLMSLCDDNDVLWHALQQPQIIGVEQLSLGNTASAYMFSQLVGDRPPRIRKRIQELAVRFSEHHATYGDSDAANHRLALGDANRLKLTNNSDINCGDVDTLTGQRLADFQALQDVLGYRFDLAQALVPSAIVRGQPFKTVLYWHNSGNGAYPPIEVRRPEIELYQGGVLVWPPAPIGNAADLTQLYPSAGPLAVETTHTVTGIAPGLYDVRLRIPPPDSRAGALHLGITGRESNGSYPLKTGVQVR